MITTETYLDMLIPFCNYAKREIRYVDDLHAYYGTGEAGHWAVQSNFNVTGALAVLGTYPGKIDLDQEELLTLAQKLFRYNLHTHKSSGRMTCSCGNQWGGSWISVLGLERMVMGQTSLEKILSEEDLESFRKLRVCEADHLLHEQEVAAGMIQMNKPESNYWNGSFLLRTAMDYPEEPHHDLWVEKGTKFLLNAISHPLDAVSDTLYNGKALREWHVGANFTANYSLDHHGYMNVGYSVVTLSHAAYLYFYCKAKGYEFPEAARLHLSDLWNVVKNFIYPDGRLLRIGGDTRARYCYCQAYLLSVLLMMEDLYSDTASAAFEKGLLGLFSREQKENPDGSFYGTRLEEMKYQSRYYYTRLESDVASVLGNALAVRSQWKLAQAPEKFVPPACQWEEGLHCANLLRSEKIVRSVVRRAGEGPTLLAQTLERSNLGEWSGNGFMRLTGRKVHALHEQGFQRSFPGGFLNSGSSVHVEYDPWGEGEDSFRIARSRSAAAALPDGKTLIVLEYGSVVKEHYLQKLSTINFQIPNDVYNGKKRCFKGENFSCELVKRSGKGVIDTKSRFVNVDDTTTVLLGYGADSLKIFAPAEDLAVIRHKPGMTSLYFNSICGDVSLEAHRSRMPGEVLADTAYAVIAGVTAEQSCHCQLKQIETEGLLRAVEFVSPEGCWKFAANFSTQDLLWENRMIVAGECILIHG